MTVSRAGFAAFLLLFMVAGLLLATVISELATYFTAGLMTLVATSVLITDVAHGRR